MAAHPKWKRLFALAMAEENPARLKKCLDAAQVAMMSAAEAMLNSDSGEQKFDELMEAMLALYEHGLRKGLNMPKGTFNRNGPMVRAEVD